MNTNGHLDVDLGFLSEEDSPHTTTESAAQDRHVNAVHITPPDKTSVGGENHSTTVTIDWKDLAVFVGILVFILIFLAYLFSAMDV